MHVSYSEPKEITMDLTDCIFIHNKRAGFTASGLDKSDFNFVIKGGVILGQCGLSFKKKLIRTVQIIRIIWGKTPTNIAGTLFQTLK